MNDTQIADRIVQLGIGKRLKTKILNGNYTLWPTYKCDDGPFTATEFINDWRVIGSLLELSTDVHIDRLHGIKEVYFWNKAGPTIEDPGHPLTRHIAVAFFDAADDTLEVTRPMETLDATDIAPHMVIVRDNEDIDNTRTVAVADVLAQGDEDDSNLPPSLKRAVSHCSSEEVFESFDSSVPDVDDAS